jgi:hypothetical protein
VALVKHKERFYMKIRARAAICGTVEDFDAEAGTLVVAGLKIHTRHGAVVGQGDFIELAATLGQDQIWTGEITANYTQTQAPAGQPAPAPRPQAASGTIADPPAPPAPPGGAAGEAGSPAGTPVADSRVADSRAAAPASGAAQTPQGESASGQSAGSSRSARFNRASGSQPSATSARPVAGGSGGPGRPPFVPSAEDRKVSY